MCGEFGEVTVIIGLVINFLAFVSLLFAFRDTSTYWFENKNTKVLHLHGWERSGTDMDISMAGAAA